MIKKSPNQIRLEFLLQSALEEKAVIMSKIKKLRIDLAKDNKSKMTAKQLESLKKAQAARIYNIKKKTIPTKNNKN